MSELLDLLERSSRGAVARNVAGMALQSRAAAAVVNRIRDYLTAMNASGKHPSKISLFGKDYDTLYKAVAKAMGGDISITGLNYNGIEIVAVKS